MAPYFISVFTGLKIVFYVCINQQVRRFELRSIIRLIFNCHTCLLRSWLSWCVMTSALPSLPSPPLSNQLVPCA